MQYACITDVGSMPQPESIIRTPVCISHFNATQYVPSICLPSPLLDVDPQRPAPIHVKQRISLAGPMYPSDNQSSSFASASTIACRHRSPLCPIGRVMVRSVSRSSLLLMTTLRIKQQLHQTDRRIIFWLPCLPLVWHFAI